MGTAAAIVAVVGGLATTIIGAKQKSDANKAIEDYNRQQLKTVTEDIGVSTLGSKLQREELARATASGIAALQSGGARSVTGGIGRLEQINKLQGREIGAGLDAQQKEIDKLIARDKARVQLLKEQRERADLAGLGQQLAVGEQNIFKGISGAVQGISSFANIREANKATETPETPVNSGYNPFSGMIGASANPFL